MRESRERDRLYVNLPEKKDDSRCSICRIEVYEDAHGKTFDPLGYCVTISPKMNAWRVNIVCLRCIKLIEACFEGRAKITSLRTLPSTQNSLL